ncbi:MAG: hypothetical protein KDJ36_07725 [Hyphomicrobiaceae bacterium]|nr:hypothetical protein [Hyphomicrobiaceae bacterium]
MLHPMPHRDRRLPSLIHGDQPADSIMGYGVAAIALILAWTLFAWPWLSGKYVIPWDAAAHFAPQVQFMAQSFARGEWPFWNPYAFSGQVQIADPQSMLFSPPMVTLALLDPSPGLWSINATVLAMLLVAGLGALAFAAHRGWHWSGGLIAALGFAFGAAMAWRLQHFGQVFSLAYFPFALLFLERALARGSLIHGTLAGIFSAFIVLGRDQVGLICVYLLIGRVIWHWFCDDNRARRVIAGIPALTAGGVTGLTLIALPILMTVNLANLSNRPSIDYAGAAAGSLHPALFVTAAIPHLFGPAGEMANYWGPPSFAWSGTGLFIAQNMGQLYIGALPLLLLIWGAVRGELWRPEIRYVTICLIVVCLYALGGYTPAFRGIYAALPGVDLYRRPADAVFVIGGLGALLAGFATHRLMSSSSVRPTPKEIAIAGTLLVAPFLAALVFARLLDRMPQAIPPLLLALAWMAAAALMIAAAVWLRPIRPLLAGILLGGLSASDLAFNNGPNGASALPSNHFTMLDPRGSQETIAKLKSLVAAASSPTRRPRVELVGLGFHWPNASLTHRLEHTLGYNPVRLKLTSDAVGAGDTIGLPDQRLFTPLFQRYNGPLANLLGLRFIASSKPLETFVPARRTALPLVARTADAYIYENRGALPRVMFATRSQTANFAEIIRTGVWPRTDFERTVLLESQHGATRPRRAGKAFIRSYRNTEIVVETDSPDGGWLILNDPWHPWWRAEVNGRSTPLLRANVLFRAVEVPRGKSRVRFVFRPIQGTLQGLIEPSRPSR